MTSQVAVANCYGVSVASDTVVSRDTRGGMKTVGHTNKIFELGDEHKVLVLHSNVTVINQVPAKLYVVEWSKTLAGPLPTLQAYVDSFLSWAKSAAHLHTPESEKGFVGVLLDMHFRYLYETVESRLGKSAGDGLPKDVAPEIREQTLSEVLNQALSSLQSQDLLQNQDLMKAEAALSLAGDMYQSKLDYWIAEYMQGDALTDLIRTSTLEALVRTDSLTEWDCNLSFVGYGASEIFPSSEKLVCRGFVNNELLHVRYESLAIRPGERSSIVSFFAQDDAIQSFLRGFHTETLMEVRRAIRESISEVTSDTVTTQQIDEIISKTVDHVQGFSGNRFVDPLLHEIEGMTNTRLSEFAEALVGLQATASNSQDGPATVGGFIEVAVIDREHGVRWVKSLTSHR